MKINLRDPKEIMKLSRLGSFHQSKLSFLRSFLQEFKDWDYNKDLFDLNEEGHGTAIYSFKKNYKIYSLICFSNKIKDELLVPTKIYSSEILKLVKKNYINACAHITGGGLIENLLRSVPEKFSVKIDLSKIKVKKIFKWIKSKNISDKEMLNTFNCGVGFCLIVPKKNVKKITSFFSKEYLPYEIGKITYSSKKINLLNSLKW